MTVPGRATTLLFHMLVGCNRLAELRAETTEQAFKRNYRLYELALRYIEMMGEAARRLEKVDPAYLQRHGIVTARDVIGIRNRIAHEYEAIDLDLVWRVLTQYAPALQAMIVPVLAELGPEFNPDSLDF